MTPARTSAADLLARAAGSSPLVSMLVILTVAVVTALGTGAPALIAAGRTDTVRNAVTELPPPARDVTGSLRGVFASAAEGADGWGLLRERLDDIKSRFPDDVREVTGSPRAIVALDPATTSAQDRSPRPYNLLTLVFDATAADRIDVVDAWPEPSRGSLPIALSESSAAAMAWPLGEERDLAAGGATIELQLVELFRASDPLDRDWSYEPTALSASTSSDASGNIIVNATALADADRIADAVTWNGSATTSVWFPLAAELVAGERATALAAQLRGLAGSEFELPMRADNQYPRGLALSSGSVVPLQTGAARGDVMVDVAALASSVAAATAAIGVGMIARILARTHAGSLSLARARGASRRMLWALAAGEGALLAGTGAAVAGVCTSLLGWGVNVAIAALVVAAVVSVLAGSAAERPRGGLGGRTGRWRVVAESAVVAVAAGIVSWVTVRPRDELGADPLLLATPVLVAAVGCVFAIRGLDATLGLIVNRARRCVGPLILLGAARARRAARVRFAPMLVAVLGITGGVFALAFGSTVQAGIDTAAGERVGSDVRVAAPYLSRDVLSALTSLPGVDAAATVVADARLTAESAGESFPVRVFAVDARALAAVQDGSPDAIPTAGLTADAGGEGIPVVVSRAVADRAAGAALTIDGAATVIVGEGAAASPLGESAAWVLVDSMHAGGLLPRTFSPTVLLLRAAEGAADDVAADAARLAGAGTQVSTRASFAAEISDDPSLRTLQVTLWAATSTAAGMLVIAVASALILATRERVALFSVLRALGQRRGRLLLTLWEVLPALAAALPSGLAVGAALAWVVLPSLDLAELIAGGPQPPVVLSGTAILAVAVCAVAVSLIAATAASALALAGHRSTEQLEEPE